MAGLHQQGTLLLRASAFCWLRCRVQIQTIMIDVGAKSEFGPWILRSGPQFHFLERNWLPPSDGHLGLGALSGDCRSNGC
jgi:hypothetical protein